MTSLSDTILFGNTEEVTALLRQGVPINEIDAYGFTPLIEASIINNIEITSLLLKQGAEVNQTDLTGGTALHWAADNGNIKLCELLLDHHSNPNAYTLSTQPVLLYPLLRRHKNLLKVFYKYGAYLDFAQDFINTKLLGHRFELTGLVDIVSPQGKFIELDFEGFILEFTVNLIADSLLRFQNNYSAKDLQKLFPKIKKILESFQTASELLKFQHHTINLKINAKKIASLINKSDLVFLPIGYKGHAISLVKLDRYFAVCDRGERSFENGSVAIYYLNNKDRFDEEFIKNLLYLKQSKAYVEEGIKVELGLTPLTSLPLPPQITGNCSWANIEGVIPLMLFLLFMQESKSIEEAKQTSIQIFNRWRNWDRARALEECINSFYSADRRRKASKASILGTILFQRARYEKNSDPTMVEKLLKILDNKEFRYVLRSYKEGYEHLQKDEWYTNYMRLLEVYDVNLD